MTLGNQQSIPFTNSDNVGHFCSTISTLCRHDQSLILFSGRNQIFGGLTSSMQTCCITLKFELLIICLTLAESFIRAWYMFSSGEKLMQLVKLGQTNFQ